VFGPYASADPVYQTLRALKSALVGASYLPGLFIVPRRGSLLPPLGSDGGATSFTGEDHVQAAAAAAEVEQFLAGRTQRVVKLLQRQLRAAAASRQYERAASLRDQLQAIARVLERQQAITSRNVDWDVVSLFREGSRSAVNVFKVRGGKIVDRVVTALEHGADVPDQQVLEGFLAQLYQSTDDRPGETVVGPSRGLRGELWRKGLQNAEHHLRADALRHQPTWDGAAASRQLALALGLPSTLHRIELIDVSHLQGTSAVASLVVATEGVPDSSQYRRYRIKVARGGDDYGSMREVVGRRAARRDWPRPDLLVLDGGAGQLAAARETLVGTPLADVPTAAIAKREELIYLDPRTPPLRLPRRSAALQLVQRLRDEAHRFAITYNRKLRSRAMLGAGKNTNTPILRNTH
jgi:excinuclease ABC subunit C